MLAIPAEAADDDHLGPAAALTRAVAGSRRQRAREPGRNLDLCRVFSLSSSPGASPTEVVALAIVGAGCAPCTLPGMSIVALMPASATRTGPDRQPVRHRHHYV